MKINCSYIKIFTVLALAVLTTAGFAQEKEEFPILTVTPEKKLTETDQGVEITDGKCLLFQIKTSSGGDPRIDARVITSLVFEVPENLSSFTLTEEDFEKKKAYVVISDCRCIDRGYNPVFSGYINGEKTKNGDWKVKADVTARGIDSGEEKPFKFEGVIPVSR